MSNLSNHELFVLLRSAKSERRIQIIEELKSRGLKISFVPKKKEA